MIKTRFRSVWNRMREESRGMTPFEIHPVYLLLLFFIAITLTGNPLKAISSVEQLVIDRGGLGRFGKEKTKDVVLTNVEMVEVFTLIVMPPIIGIVFDYAGCTLTIALSCLQMILGYCFMIFPKYQTKLVLSIGSFFLASSYYSSFLSHNIVTGLFPVNEALCVAILGTAGKLSEHVPGMLKKISDKLGSIVHTFVLYLVLVFIIGLIEITLLYQLDKIGLKGVTNMNHELGFEKGPNINNKNSNIHTDKESSSDSSLINVENKDVSQQNIISENSFANSIASTNVDQHIVRGLRNSLKTLDYWVFAVISCIMVIQDRSQSIVAQSLIEIVGLRTPIAPTVVKTVDQLFEDIGWLSFIPLLCFGIAFDIAGIPAVICIVHLIITSIYILSSIGIYPLFIVVNSLRFIVADMTYEIKIVFMLHYFGLKHIGVLMGILESLTNLTFLGFLFIILIGIVHPTIDMATALVIRSTILWISGLVVFPLALTLWYLANRRKQRHEKERKRVTQSEVLKGEFDSVHI